jgi:hypothetical protein
VLKCTHHIGLVKPSTGTPSWSATETSAATLHDPSCVAEYGGAWQIHADALKIA